jgi:hypothetical protein
MGNRPTLTLKNRDDMLFNRKEFHNMEMIRTTSKDALKRSLMQMYQGDVATMERMYDFYMKDMQNVPDFDPVAPSMLQQAKTTIGDLFGWADANQEKLVGAYNLFRAMKSGEPISAVSAATPVADVPPLPKL